MTKLSTNHVIKLDIEGIYIGLKPIRPNFKINKKELESNDFLKLFGALVIIARNNKEVLHDYYYQSLTDVIESASVQDDEIYLFNFEGYELNERYILRTLYLDQNDRVIMSVCDNKKNRYIDFLAD